MTESETCQSKEDSESYNSALKAMEDLTGTTSENIPNIKEPLKEPSKYHFVFLQYSERYTSLNTVRKQKDISVDNVTELMSKITPNEDERANSCNENELKRNPLNNQSTCSEVSSVAIDSKGGSETLRQLDSAKGNSDNETKSYSPDFSPESSSKSKEEITAWEKWFVMKQEEIRKRTEEERNRKIQEIAEIKRKEELKQKKLEESKVNRKQWLKMKKIEEKEKREAERKEKDLLEKERRIKKLNPEYTFKKWSLRKHQEKRFDLLEKDYIRKQDEEEKKKRLRQNEEAIKRWMSKAKNRPTTPQITYAYCGGSAIGFYDSTRPPPPAYVNPVPWQDPF